jgi:2-dehydro-3-deoxy-D-arabinonate dehydratase
VGVLEGGELLDVTGLAPWLCDTLSLLEEAARRRIGLQALVREAVASRADAHPERFGFAALSVPPDPAVPHLLLPVHPPEVWGFGVTYRRSAEMRDTDTGTTIYDYAYSQARPEVFFKATASRCSGPNGLIGLRWDSSLMAAEPELAFVLGGGRDVLAFTLCNDVSAWDIERENPLYLPQGKIFTGCCALGPVLATPEAVGDAMNLDIECRIHRGGQLAFEGSTNSSLLRRSFEEMTDYLTRCNPVPVGTVVTTGTGIIVPTEMALKEGDVVEIEVQGIGVLRNVAQRVQ